VGDTLQGGDGADQIIGSDEGAEDPDFSDAVRFGDYIDAGLGADNVWGLGGADFIQGGDGNDVLDGGAGDNIILAGFAGANDFAVNNFRAGEGTADRIDVSSFGVEFDWLMAHASESDGDVVLDLGTQHITLRGVSLSQLHQDDFLLS
jgi:Ca2+-binding RTX toxin-like protein